MKRLVRGPARSPGRVRLLPAAAFLLLCWQPLHAQEADSSNAPAPPGDTPREEAAATAPALLEASTVQAALDALGENRGIDDSAKDALRPKYAAVLETLKLAAENEKRTANYRDAIETAPIRTGEIRQKTGALPAPEEVSAPPVFANTEALKKDRDAKRAELLTLKKQLEEHAKELSAIKGRPVEIGARLPEARKELAQADSSLAAMEPSSPSDTPTAAVARMELQAQRALLSSEVEMLLQEQLSQTTREELASVRDEYLRREVEIATGHLAAIEEALKEALKSDAERLVTRVAQLADRVGPEDSELVALVAEAREFSSELLESAHLLKEADELQAALAANLAKVQRDFKAIREQIDLGGLEGSFSQVIIEQRRRLPNPRHFAFSIRARASKLQELRLAEFGVGDALRSQGDLEKQLQEEGSQLEADLLALRRELLEKLQRNYETLISDLARIDAEERSYRDAIIEARDYLSDEMFWRRSSPPMSLASLKEIPGAIRWLLAPARWQEGWGSLRNALLRRPFATLVVVLAVTILSIRRKRIIAGITKTGEEIRRIRTDRYSHTLRALLGTLLLALPIPLAIAFLAWAINHEPGGSDWVRGTAKGLEWTSIILAWAWFLTETCRKNGLGPAHFGWNAEIAKRGRKTIRRILSVYLPALLVIGATFYEDSAKHFDSVGRLAFNLSHLWVAMILWKDLRPSDGLFTSLIRDNPGHFLARSRHAWFSLSLAFPIGLVILANAGWMVAAVALSIVFLGTLGILAIGSLAYSLILRWFMIRERRLALQKALDERKAREETAQQPGSGADETIVADEAERELDLASIGQQTRRLLHSLTGLGIALLIWLFWTTYLPIDQALAGASIWKIDLLKVVQGIIVAVIFTTLARNLSGLLELTGLRTVVPDHGTRYAIASISQYAVTAAGIVALARIFEFEWSQLGWIAAALSVGLGFGLQEIVANFVCGIILLFERPIRVGDIVTVDNVDGTVTRIRMRATTITNWDRKEFVVPNKQFITGTLMNWTLSNPITRIVITVGVAYGSDTRKARDILLSVAHDHPRVLDDPQPAATFEQFADSSLNLLLRCFLPNMENRIGTITDLHTEIDERFKEAGIEISFPQRDLHIRSLDETVARGLRDSDAS